MDFKSKYLKYKQKYLLLKKYNQVGGSNKPKLYLFKAEWCGHCRNFKDTWKQLQNNNELKNKVDFITIDHSDSNIKNWNIEGYPTILLEKNNNKIEFNGARQENNIIDFVNQHA